MSRKPFQVLRLPRVPGPVLLPVGHRSFLLRTRFRCYLTGAQARVSSGSLTDLATRLHFSGKIPRNLVRTLHFSLGGNEVSAALSSLLRSTKTIDFAHLSLALCRQLNADTSILIAIEVSARLRLYRYPQPSSIRSPLEVVLSAGVIGEQPEIRDVADLPHPDQPLFDRAVDGPSETLAAELSFLARGASAGVC